MKQTARSTALNALLQMEKNEGYSNLVIDKALKSAGLDKRDSALAAAIFYGVLEKQTTLDWTIAQCLRDPRKKLNKEVRMALRCGAYQILYLDRVPDSAVVNETVNDAKDIGKAEYAGFINGVLRNLIRKKEELVLPAGNGVLALSLRYSVPEELIRMWQSAYGRENTLRLLHSFVGKAPTYIRVNALKTSFSSLAKSLKGHEALLEPCLRPEGAGILHCAGSPTELPEFQEGLFHVQDLSAQFVCEILDPQPGESICDCCAAPGGKTFTIAQRMKGEGQIIALDLYKGRVNLVKSGAQRLGIQSITAEMADATRPLEGLPPMDRVLCDVPCSGFGVIRRKPEIRYKSLAELRELPKLQFAILNNASCLVKPGGVLVYSTCTLNPRENGEVAERFLRENNGFEPMTIHLPVSETAAGEPKAGAFRRCVEEPPHHLTMMPFAGASDGFFAAAFRRRHESERTTVLGE